MINVELIAETNQEIEDLTSHAAKTCYTSKVPKMGQKIDVKNALFNTGHHTTLQHSYFTFSIEGISVSAATFGLHLASPFYNTDQRSGRYSKMYSNPDLEQIKAYINHFYPNLNKLDKVMDFIKLGTDIYSDNIDKLTPLVAEKLKKERPFSRDDAIERTAPKIAQEQLRNFISIIAPTALDFTVNISALTAYYRSAWTPELKEIFGKMKDAVIQKHPEVSYMFDENKNRDINWHPEFERNYSKVKDLPELKLLEVNIDEKALDLEKYNKDSVDINYFTPEKMENNVQTIKTEVNFSVATMGQDQRHRTIKRTAPSFTGDFYLPKLTQEVPELKEKAEKYMDLWLEISKSIPKTLATAIAPYGAMVRYKKLSDINALQHEQGKRTCFCAQEEIYWVSVLTREALKEKGYKKVCEIFAPACYNDKCIEGKRYCGRDLKDIENFFPHRLV
ncbi:MAG: FAD-dependent thymidylate synthase [Alphaproteobacteria bacterium]|nr:FAD-dependent thymidylate synthase [Alphaproteobacteria bacterium]